MGVLDMTAFVERLRFFDGQRLFADDLQGVDAFNREMRWLHNRSLHQPGIGSGYAVSGPLDGREVTVGPGYALDGEGREIVLTTAVVVAVPPVAHGRDTPVAYFDLTVSYPGDEALQDTTAETRGGVCTPAGAVRLREKPVICWVPLRGPIDALKPETAEMLSDLRLFRKVVLARVGIENCKIRSLELAVRAATRPACRPYIACGTAAVAKLQFKERVSMFARVEATVDTSGGRFRATPCYLARVEGAAPVLNTTAEIDATQPKFHFPHPVFTKLHVIQPTPVGFIAGIIVPLNLGTASGHLPPTEVESKMDMMLKEATKRAREEWSIAWMGVEE